MDGAKALNEERIVVGVDGIRARRSAPKLEAVLAKLDHGCRCSVLVAPDSQRLPEVATILKGVLCVLSLHLARWLLSVNFWL